MSKLWSLHDAYSTLTIKFFKNNFNSFLDASSDICTIGSIFNFSHSLGDDGASENGGTSRSVSRVLICIIGDILDHFDSDILSFIF